MFRHFKRAFGDPEPIPEPTWRAVTHDSALIGSLDDEQRSRVRALTAVFLQRCPVIGARGFAPDAQLMVRVAGEACTLLPGLQPGLDAYRQVRELVLYPGGFRVTQRWTDDDGVAHEREVDLAGETWQEGRVILARDDVERPDAGFNVVVHEFAHVLDAANGTLNGFPAIEDGALRKRWPGIFQSAYADLQQRERRGIAGPIDAYALEDPAEFFAVASESFFTDPVPLTERWPAVYEALSAYYGQSPLSRFVDN